MPDQFNLRLPKSLTEHHLSLHFDDTFSAVIAAIVLMLIVIGLSILCFYIARFFILRTVKKLSETGKYQWLASAYHRRVFHRIAMLAPAIILYAAVPLFANVSFTFVSMWANPIRILSASYIVIVSALAISGFLDSVEDRYNHFKFARQRPIKSYLQVVKIILLVLVLLILVSVWLDKSLGYFITGLGAMTAVILLVFRDSILGFVASVQLSAYDLVRIGDWVEIPSFGADGHVIDVSLNTIKVENFDKSIILIPSHAFLSNGVKNWREVCESGIRRVKRSIYIDPTFIKFSADKENTNLGEFRAHVDKYLQAHPSVSKEIPFLVRILEAQCNSKGVAKGLPVELSIFLKNTDSEHFEHTQSQIFEHIYAMLPSFELQAAV